MSYLQGNETFDGVFRGELPSHTEISNWAKKGSPRSTGAMNDFTCWKHMTYSDSFDTKNVEKHRPLYHQTPLYGWMNDPNGMFFIGQFDGHKFTCEDEPSETKWMDYGKVRQLRIFVDRCSVEAFDGDGKMCMTNLVFPSTPYDKIIVKGKAKATIYKIKTKK